MTSSRHLRILLIDDSENEVVLLEKAFEGQTDLEIVRQAVDGDEALAYLHETALTHSLPDMVLLDVHMPGRDGFDVLREIKKNPRLAAIPVVMLTTSCREEDVRRAYAEGAASFVSKPLTFEALCDLAKGFSSYWGSVASLPRT
jgi:CheY-like chemotaxis protein